LKLSRTSEEDEEEECLQCIAGVAVKNGVTGIKIAYKARKITLPEYLASRKKGRNAI